MHFELIKQRFHQILVIYLLGVIVVSLAELFKEDEETGEVCFTLLLFGLHERVKLQLVNKLEAPEVLLVIRLLRMGLLAMRLLEAEAEETEAGGSREGCGGGEVR